MKHRRSNLSTSSAGERIVDGSKLAPGPRLTLEEEAVECPRSFIEKHFFYSNGQEETEEKENKVVILRRLFEEERQRLDKAAERRGLQTTSIGSRLRNWTLVIGHDTQAVCREVEELFWKEAEQARASESYEKADEEGQRPLAAQTQDEYERMPAQVEAAEEREEFLEEWRTQRKVSEVKVKKEYKAFLKTINETAPKYGLAGEWRVQSYDFEHDLPESSCKFNLTLSFPKEEEEGPFGAFDFDVLNGLLMLDSEDFGSGKPARHEDWRSLDTGGYVHHTNFCWLARDTKGYHHEGEGYLSMAIGSSTQMKGVLIGTSLPSSLSAYEFEAFQVSSNPIPSLYSSWEELRHRVYFNPPNNPCENRSDIESKDEHSDHHCETNTRPVDCPRIDRGRKNRQELEYELQNSKMEIRKLIEEKASTVRIMGDKVMGIYRQNAKGFHEYSYKQFILSEKQAAEIASLKLELARHNDGLPTRGKKRTASECLEKLWSRPKGKEARLSHSSWSSREQGLVKTLTD